MPSSKDFTNYNKRYLELQEIFEFLFPIRQNDGDSLRTLTGTGKRTLFDCYKVILKRLKKNTDLARNSDIFGERKNSRICIEHNSYQIENELWYNIIFTLFQEEQKDEISDEEKYEEPEKTDFFEKFINQFGKKEKGEEHVHAFLGVMDKVIPFSTIAYWMYLRTMGKKEYKSLPIMFHNSNPRIGGLQDMMYQILYIIQMKNDMKVYINKIGPFQFKEILYDDVSLNQTNNNPYILASYGKGEETGDIKIYIRGDMDIKISKSKLLAKDEKISVENIDGNYDIRVCRNGKSYSAARVYLYTKTFWYTLYIITNEKDIKGEYLKHKVENDGKWFDKDLRRSNRILKLSDYRGFQYYGYQETEWAVLTYHFSVNEKDCGSFERWANSFGDFAYWEKREEGTAKSRNIFMHFAVNSYSRLSKEKDEKIPDKLPTLLNYNNCCEKLEGKKEYVSADELNCFKFMLEQYPNFCKVFLYRSQTHKVGNIKDIKAKELIENKKRKMNAESNYNPFYSLSQNTEKTKKDTANKNPMNYLCDMNETIADKMYGVMEGIKGRNYYRQKRKDNEAGMAVLHNAILPYAVDVDVLDFDGSSKGISVMAYDLVQKRVIAIPFVDYRFGKSENGSDGRIDYTYGDYDKLYYFCSYFVKLYFQKKYSAKQLVQRLFDEEHFPSDFNPVVHFESEAEVFKQEEIISLFEKSLDQWIKYDPQKDIKQNGVSLFTQKEIDYKKSVGNVICYILTKKQAWFQTICDLLTDQVCEEFIIGNTYEAVRSIFLNKYKKEQADHKLRGCLTKDDFILNEIQFINSVLKIHELVFRIKDECLDKEDKSLKLETAEIIYDYFRDFNCAGRRCEDGSYLFKVQYEGFQYRKIHEIILALSNWIEIPRNITFEQPAEIIFRMKEKLCDNKVIEALYDKFKNYVCAQKKGKDNHLLFIVQYKNYPQKKVKDVIKKFDEWLEVLECATNVTTVDERSVGQNIETEKLILQSKGDQWEVTPAELIYKYFKDYDCTWISKNGHYYLVIQYEKLQYDKISEIIREMGSSVEVRTDIAAMEQNGQSELFKYRSVEGKEALRKALEALKAYGVDF